MNNRDRLRRELRQLRARLDPAQRRKAALAVARRLAKSPVFSGANTVAAYIPVGGELDPGPVLEHALSAGKQAYLPRLIDPPDVAMHFLRYTADTALTPNRYGIPEPPDEPARRIDPRQLDLVLVPLVAFDVEGNRLGMGAGYYDRTFAFLKQPSADRPRLLGVAYDFQRTPSIDAADWDVPLWGVVTEKRLYHTMTGGEAGHQES